MLMLPFPVVRAGDKIALVATARPGSLAEVDGVKRIIEQTYGVNVIYLVSIPYGSAWESGQH